MNTIFKGSGVALVTPFKNNQIDFASLEQLIEFQILNKTDAIIVLGTTGEAPTITTEERHKIVEFSKNKIKNRCALIVGTGSNNLSQAIEYTKDALKCKADGVLAVTPYYNKCTEEGLIAYYEAISGVGIPTIAYNVPSRTGVNISLSVLEKLVNNGNICGLKEATSELSQIVTELSMFNNFPIYSGSDEYNDLFLKLGASGIISVTANAFPKLTKNHCDLVFNKKFGEASVISGKLSNLNKLLFCEPNPIPIKYLLYKMNMIQPEIRLPLTWLTEFKKQKLLNAAELLWGEA